MCFLAVTQLQEGSAMSDELPVQTGSAGLVDRAKSILMTPKEEWPKVAAETKNPTQVLVSYALPLIAIGPIASLIGMQLFGINVLFGTIRPSLGFALSTAITAFVMSVVSLYVLSFIANFLSPKFGGKDSFPDAFRLVAYSMTAAWLVGILNLITGFMPVLGILGLLGLYSIYLLYLGSTPVMGVPQDKATGYTAVTFVAAIVLYLIAAALVAATTGAFGLAATGAGIASSTEQTTIDLGELGNVTVDADNQTVDMGELGRVEINGDTATVTVDGQEIQVNVEQAAAAAKKAAAAQQAE
jgi:hypothetical protein